MLLAAVLGVKIRGRVFPSVLVCCCLHVRSFESRTEYTLEELKQKPPPEGVDPSRLEVYLNADDFQVKSSKLFPFHAFVLFFLHLFIRSFAGYVRVFVR